MIVDTNIRDRCHDITRRILQQLQQPASLCPATFWQEVSDAGLPLVRKTAAESDEREVTFLWRTGRPLQGVYLFLNRITDKQQVAKGMMTPLCDRTIWSVTLTLPASYRGSYTITEIPHEALPEDVALLGGRQTPFIGQCDPLNRASGIRSSSGYESVLALDRAPEQREWLAQPAPPRGELIDSQRLIAGKQRRIRLYLPDVGRDEPLGLLVLPDAESWFDRLSVASALDNALDQRRIAPMAILGIDNLDVTDRKTILAGNVEFVREIAERLIPQIRAEQPDRRWADRSRTVLSGQSLGGLTALLAARHASDTFGAILSLSPSMWWGPDKTRPSMTFSENDRSWVSDHLLSNPPQKVKMALGVGSLEGAIVPHVQQLHQRLRMAGCDTSLRVYTGGHDYAWWRGALFDLLV